MTFPSESETVVNFYCLSVSFIVNRHRETTSIKTLLFLYTQKLRLTAAKYQFTYSNNVWTANVLTFLLHSMRAHVPVSTFTRMMMCCDDPLVRDVRKLSNVDEGKREAGSFLRWGSFQNVLLCYIYCVVIPRFDARRRHILPRFLFQFIGISISGYRILVSLTGIPSWQMLPRFSL